MVMQSQKPVGQYDGRYVVRRSYFAGLFRDLVTVFKIAVESYLFAEHFYWASSELLRVADCLMESVAAEPVMRRAPRLKVKYSKPHWMKTITRL